MESNNIDVRPVAEYDSKTVKIQNPPGAYVVMLTAFEAERNHLLHQKGFHGRYVLFTCMEGNVAWSDHDPFRLMMDHRDEVLKEFTVNVRIGWQDQEEEGISWEDVEDGAVYTEEDIEELKGGG